LEERTINDKNEVKYVGFETIIIVSADYSPLRFVVPVFVNHKPVKYQWVFRGELQIELLRLLHPDSAIDFFVGFNESLFLNLSLKTDPFQKFSNHAPLMHNLQKHPVFFHIYPYKEEKIKLHKLLLAFLVLRYHRTTLFHFDIDRIS
jgi:hypothetical protein